MKKGFNILLILCAALVAISCSKTKSYTDMLKDEKEAIERLIDANDFEILDDFPKDSIFKENQFVKLENGVYLNIIDKGSSERAVQYKTKMSNVIKNGGEDLKAPEFAAFDKLKDIFDQMKDIPEAEKFIKEAKKAKDNKPKVSDIVTVGYGVYILDSFEDFEDMCMVCPKVWGVANGIYKKDNRYYLVLEKGRCARERYNSICNVISEYARLDSEKEQRVIWVKENCEAVIKANAISKVKKYL